VDDHAPKRCKPSAPKPAYTASEGNNEHLVYIGEGAIRARLLAHLAKLNAASAQGRALYATAPLSFSAAPNPTWRRHQRLELETDLIGAYVLATHKSPAAQFIG
jgi:hypothetical protein